MVTRWLLAGLLCLALWPVAADAQSRESRRCFKTANAAIFGSGPSYSEARRWCLSSAEQGDAWAMCWLGLLLDYRPIDSYMWYTLARKYSPFDPLGDGVLESVSDGMDRVKPGMKAWEIAEAENKALEWLREHPPSSAIID